MHSDIPTYPSFSRERSAGPHRPTPGLTLLYHPELERIGERADLSALLSGSTVQLSRLQTHFAPLRGGRPQPLKDPFLSRSPLKLRGVSEDQIELSPGGPRLRIEIDGESIDSCSDLPMRISHGRLTGGVVVLMARRVVLLLHHLAPVAEQGETFGLLGESAGIARVRREVLQVADLPCSVLLRGESGTGKELVARAIHEAGPRRAGPFVAVNLGAVPASLAASELFGSVKGAFSDAQRRRGFFGRAHGGTLFLDEIGEAPEDVQAPLLRALEAGEIQPVGAEEPRRVNVRVVSATDADLERAVEEGSFRAPLVHRLGGYEIFLPPLRERREDLGVLLAHFLRTKLAEIGETSRLETPAGTPQWLPAELVARLVRFDWPGNVRQLQNAAGQIVTASRNAEEVVVPDSVERTLARESDHASTPASPEPDRQVGIRKAPTAPSPEQIRRALRAEDFIIARAAERLGMSRPTLSKRMSELGIRRAKDLMSEEIEDSLEQHDDDLNLAARSLEVSRKGLLHQMGQLGIKRGDEG